MIKRISSIPGKKDKLSPSIKRFPHCVGLLFAEALLEFAVAIYSHCNHLPLLKVFAELFTKSDPSESRRRHAYDSAAMYSDGNR